MKTVVGMMILLLTMAFAVCDLIGFARDHWMGNPDSMGLIGLIAGLIIRTTLGIGAAVAVLRYRESENPQDLAQAILARERVDATIKQAEYDREYYGNAKRWKLHELAEAYHGLDKEKYPLRKQALLLHLHEQCAENRFRPS